MDQDQTSILKFLPPRKGRRHALRVIREVLEPGDGTGRDLKDLVAAVRRIEIAAQRLVNESLSGRYHSVFKGRGMSFDEVRPYTPGDEPRLIDWNVSARTGDVFVKRFTEERELTLLILADESQSMGFGLSAATYATPQGERKVEDTKRGLAAQIAAAIALSAQRNNDRVGLLTFNGGVGDALSYAGRVIKRRTAIFIVSDFEVPDFERELRVAVRRHDVHALIVREPVEDNLTDSMPGAWPGTVVTLRDCETQEVRDVYVTPGYVQRFKAASKVPAGILDTVFKRLRVPYTRFSTAVAYDRVLAGHFARLKGKAL